MAFKPKKAIRRGVILMSRQTKIHAKIKPMMMMRGCEDARM